ncbi:hypothetical protein CEB3_c37990 [Peptococcaceae bacterium CEB3]|nr:hypothetical protein CEB3_c37990 [Peptococcaceae bacterium CEB3]
MKAARVKAGICGFASEISASSQNGHQVDLVFHTQCPNLKPMEEELTQVDAYAECLPRSEILPFIIWRANSVSMPPVRYRAQLLRK